MAGSSQLFRASLTPAIPLSTSRLSGYYYIKIFFSIVKIIKAIIIYLVMEILGKILGSTARVKMMRLFLLNPKKGFLRKDIIKRSRVSSESLDHEIRLLFSAGFIKKQGLFWIFDQDFRYTKEMYELLINADTVDKKSLIDAFRKSGRLKFLLVSGIFIKEDDSRIDLLVVGDKMKRGKIEEEVRKLEAEIGTELRYAVFETKEFLYRIKMYDKLVRDILDFPHRVIFETRELSTQILRKV